MSQGTDAKTKAEATPGRRFVLTGLAVIGASVIGVTAFGIAQTRVLEARAKDIVDDMLTSIRLIGQLDDHVEEQHTLMDEHILATLPAEMGRVEARLAALEMEIDGTLRAYEPWINQPGERAGADQARADLMTLRVPMARALALSRDNRDDEAKDVMQVAAGQFAALDKDFERLIAINDRGATASLSRFSATRGRLMLILLSVGFVALAAIAGGGSWASRQVARREDMLSLRTRMLEARNRELDAFAGRVAHDIRGPLTTITLATTHLAALVPEERRTTDILRRGTLRMEGLVDDLLTLARVESQVRGSCDPGAAVAQLREEFAERFASERGVLRSSVDRAQVACSEGLLHQALTNLVENAVKYRRSEVPPEVQISGARTDGGYELRVADNGTGMSAEELERVFEPLYRSPRVLDVPGTGLGLSIVDRIVRASGGTISVSSNVGQGSTFIIHLMLVSRRGPADGRQHG
jgi:signal transduction histidine kinase